MNIYICTLVSKKNLKFLRSFLKSLDEIKLPGNLKFKMIFIINPKIRYSKLLIKRYLNRLDYFILESIKDNTDDIIKTFEGAVDKAAEHYNINTKLLYDYFDKEIEEQLGE